MGIILHYSPWWPIREADGRWWLWPEAIVMTSVMIFNIDHSDRWPWPLFILLFYWPVQFSEPWWWHWARLIHLSAYFYSVLVTIMYVQYSGIVYWRVWKVKATTSDRWRPIPIYCCVIIREAEGEGDIVLWRAVEGYWRGGGIPCIVDHSTHHWPLIRAWKVIADPEASITGDDRPIPLTLPFPYDKPTDRWPTVTCWCPYRLMTDSASPDRCGIRPYRPLSMTDHSHSDEIRRGFIFHWRMLLLLLWYSFRRYSGSRYIPHC